MTVESPTPRARALSIEARRRLTPDVLPADGFISFPVPVIRDGMLTASFFGASTVARVDGAGEDMHAPAAELTLDWATGRQLDLRVLRAPLAPAADVPVAPVRGLSFQVPLTPELAQQLDVQMARLDVLLEAAVARYAATPQRPPMDDGTRYLEQFEDLVPRAARTYYTALNPDFFAWVEKGR